MKPLDVVIAAGGTGGHLFPGIALAQKFREKNRNTRITFMATGRPMESEILSRNGFAHQPIAAEGLKGRARSAQFRALTRLPRGFVQAARWMVRRQPDLVMGMGGYVAAPVVMAARFLGIPVAIHEQNRLPGMTNRFLAVWAHRIYVSFPDSARFFPPSKTMLTGNPVRGEISDAGSRVRDEKAPFSVLVCGGSQGAHAINQAVAGSLGLLTPPAAFHVVHQTGTADFEEMRCIYGRQSVSARVAAFFHDMAREYWEADLVICRAGATTIAELSEMGKPAIFIPFPFAADDHQRLNALALVEAGAAELLPQERLTAELLASRLMAYSKHPEKIERMARRALRWGRKNAAERIVTDCYRRFIDFRENSCI